MATLEGKVPYSVLPGNPDGFSLAQTPQLYNQTFPPSRFQKYPCYGGHAGETNENNYCFFLVLSLRFGPTDADLAWASKVVSQHPKKRVIVATHVYGDAWLRLLHFDTKQAQIRVRTYSPTPGHDFTLSYPRP